MMADDTFLHRWSRRKHEAARTPDVPPAPIPTPAPTAGVVAATASAPAAPIEPSAPPLPPVESLSLASDFKPFLADKVNETVKRAALRKLFSDPHFNVMDGLDIYIGDYSKPDPVPDGLLAKLADVYRTVEEKEAAVEATPADAVLAAAKPAAEPVATPVADPAEPAADNPDESDERRR